MNETRHSPLESEVVSYRGADVIRQGWLVVVLAALFTSVTFVLLPFSELIGAPPRKKDMALRTVDTLQSRLERTPPRTQRLAPPRAPQKKAPQPRRKAKPKLDTPKNWRRRRLNLPVSLNLGLDIAGDFGLDFTLAPHPPPVVVEEEPPPPPPPEPEPEPPSVFEVEELDRAPQPIVRIPPRYPHRAKARNIEGFVELQFTVSEEGLVSDTAVVESMPGSTFVRASERAVANWRFEPGIKDGKPVAVRMQVRLRFTLR